MSASALKSAVTGQVTTKEEPKTIFGMLQVYKEQIKAALPQHMTPDRMARIVTTEIRKTPKLMECEAKSLFGAVIQCSQLGLEPGGALGHAYLIPFDKNEKRGDKWVKVRTDVQLIIGYRGMIDLARRSGQIVSLAARAVYEKDKFSYEYGLIESLTHKPYEGADRGALKYVYAVAKLQGGGTQFEVLNRFEIEAIRNESQGYKSAIKYKKTDTPWIAHFEEMAKKTAIRRLFKYLPVSIEIQRATALDEYGEAGLSQDFSGVLEGEFATVDESAVNEDESINKDTGEIVQEAPQSNNDGAPTVTYAQVEERLLKAEDVELLAVAADFIQAIADEKQKESLLVLYKKRYQELSK